MDNHFERTFRFIAVTSTIILIYVFLITFVPIPKENQRFVDIALAFLLGRFGSNAEYLTGGNPKKLDSSSTIIANSEKTTVNPDTSEKPIT